MCTTVLVEFWPESKIWDYLIQHPTHVVDARKASGRINSTPIFFMNTPEEEML